MLPDSNNFKQFLFTNRKYSVSLHPGLIKPRLSMTERHNHPRLHTLYNKGMGTAQENRNFIIKKLSDYLAVPNNLLLSHRRTVAYLHTKHFILLRARAYRTSPIVKGLNRISFALFYTFCCVALSFDISPIVDGMFNHK